MVGTVSEQPSAVENKVSIRNLNFYYGKVQTLFSINLNLAKNKVTGLIGPSGSGKSTLLRTINQIYKLYPDQRAEGEIIVDGKNLLASTMNLNTLRANIGMVFQKPSPFPMTIFKNIAFPIKLYEKLSKKDLAERVEQALTEAALWDEVKDKLDSPATSLSGGQQQRLCIARCIAIKPEILLLDEPTSALDPVSTLKIESLINNLRKKYTVIIVTHNLQQALRIADSTALMHQGRLIEFAPTQTLMKNPKDQITKNYVQGLYD